MKLLQYLEHLVSELPLPVFLYTWVIFKKVHKNASILLPTAFAQASDSRFILIAGDLTNHGYDDHLWHNFSKAFGFIPRMRPLLPVPGNHDKAKQDEGENGITVQ